MTNLTWLYLISSLNMNGHLNSLNTALYLNVDNYLYSQLNVSYHGLIYVRTTVPYSRIFFGCFKETLNPWLFVLGFRPSVARKRDIDCWAPSVLLFSTLLLVTTFLLTLSCKCLSLCCLQFVAFEILLFLLTFSSLF